MNLPLEITPVKLTDIKNVEILLLIQGSLFRASLQDIKDLINDNNL